MNKREQRQEAVERLQKLLTGVCGYGDVMNAVLGDAFIYNSSRQDALSLIDLLTDDDDMGDYIKLPRDKYGEPWHVGDVTENGNVVTGMAIDSTGEWYFINIRNDIDPQAHYHYHKPTVEDVLRELVIACEDAGNAGPAVEALISKHAERLQLKEDE